MLERVALIDSLNLWVGSKEPLTPIISKENVSQFIREYLNPGNLGKLDQLTKDNQGSTSH